MALARNIGKLSNKLAANKASLMCITRCYFDDKEYAKMMQALRPSGYKKYMPDLYPETEEERLKAAERYEMHPYEYEPYPPDERYAGDYPMLPLISVPAKDPYYPYDYPEIRRNYGEPMHHEFDLMQGDRIDFGVRQEVSTFEGCMIYLATMAFCLILYKLSPDTRFPRTEKQFPRDGVHYTFEPAK